MTDDVLNEDLVLSFDPDELEEAEPIYRTYRMDFKNKRIVGMIDGLEAAEQAAKKALMTRRFAHLIYSDQYGSDIFNKINDNGLTEDYLESDIPVMIEEALLPDERVLEITNFQHKILSSDSVYLAFDLVTIYGDLPLEEVIKDAD